MGRVAYLVVVGLHAVSPCAFGFTFLQHIVLSQGFEMITVLTKNMDCSF